MVGLYVGSVGAVVSLVPYFREILAKFELLMIKVKRFEPG